MAEGPAQCLQWITPRFVEGASAASIKAYTSLIDKWYDRLREHTFRTLFVALGPDDAQALVENHDREAHARGRHRRAVPALAALAQRLDAAMREMGCPAFVRLNTRSPKDALPDGSLLPAVWDLDCARVKQPSLPAPEPRRRPFAPLPDLRSPSPAPARGMGRAALAPLGPLQTPSPSPSPTPPALAGGAGAAQAQALGAYGAAEGAVSELVNEALRHRPLLAGQRAPVWLDVAAHAVVEARAMPVARGRAYRATRCDAGLMVAGRKFHWNAFVSATWRRDVAVEAVAAGLAAEGCDGRRGCGCGGGDEEPATWTLFELELVEGRCVGQVPGYDESELLVEPGWEWEVLPPGARPLAGGLGGVVVTAAQRPTLSLLVQSGSVPSTVCTPDDVVQRLEGLFRRAVACMDARDVKSARGLAEEALRTDPGYVPALLLLRSARLGYPEEFVQPAESADSATTPDSLLHRTKSSPPCEQELARKLFAPVAAACAAGDARDESPMLLFLAGTWMDFVLGDVLGASRLWIASASRGNTFAMNNVAWCHHHGQGVAHDECAAFVLFKKAAALGHAYAQGNLALCYCKGEGTATDKAEGIRLLHEAGSRGLAPSLSHIGWCYEKGDGVPADARQAHAYYLLAAQAGHSVAQYNLALCYENGTGVSPSAADAAAWYQLAADHGHAGSQNNLGICYEGGNGVRKDAFEGLRLYSLAARQGNAFSLYNLALCYLRGCAASVAAQDVRRASEMLRLASASGHSGAGHLLRALRARNSPMPLASP
eukprot:m51a1_g11092 hypothetical protein (772) ;mRNA; r:25726-31327